MPLQYYIGTSGWHYEHWKGRFYPDKLTKARWLEFYASHFATVELNNSFYRLLSAAAFATWRDFSPVYIYFNNDAEAFAVRNATTIGNYLQATV